VRDWDFDGQLARTLKISGFILAFLCLALFFRLQDPVLWGFVIGTAVGMWNAFFLGKRLRSIVHLMAPQANSRMKAGFAMRLSIVFAVLFFVARNGWINLYAAAAGLFVVPVIFTACAVCLVMGLSARKTERSNL